MFCASEPLPVRAPNNCLICDKNLTSEDEAIKSDKNVEIKDQESFSSDVLFILKILFHLPESLIESFLEESGKIPVFWISLCKVCVQEVARAREIYKEILELCGKFRSVQEQVVNRLCFSWGVNEAKNEKEEFQNGQRRALDVTQKCRKFVNNYATFNGISEEPFVVEDVSIFTRSLLSRLSPPGVDSLPPQDTVIIMDISTVDSAPSHDDPLSDNCQENFDGADDDDDDSDLYVDPEPEIKEEVKIESDFDENVVDNTPPPLPATQKQPDILKHSCNLCDKYFYTVQGFYRHCLKTHNVHPPGQTPPPLPNPAEPAPVEEKTLSKDLLLKEDGKYQCLNCHRNFRAARGLKNHYLRAHKIRLKITKGKKAKKVWTCSEENCHANLPTFGQYRSHMKAHQKGAPKYTCKICGKGFYANSTYYQHRRTFHKLGPKRTAESLRAECPLCHSKHLNALALRDHVWRRHPHEKVAVTADKYPCTWEGCTKTLTTPTMLKIHVSRHEGKPGYPCDACERSFYTSLELNTHKEAVHSGLQFPCDICGKAFKARANLRQHQKLKTCDLKRRQVQKPKEKKVKEDKPKSEASDNPLQCHLCGNQLKTKPGLQVHLRLVHGQGKGNPLKCHVCGRCLSYPCALTVHLARAHKIGDKNGEIHQCAVVGCRRYFHSKESLEKHTGKDHGESGMEKKFLCSFCEKSFHSKNKLTQHEMLHVNRETRPFKCETCGKGFANLHNRRYHQLNTHKAKRLIERRKETAPRSYVKDANN